MVKTMKLILTVLNDFFKNLDPVSVFFGVAVCYIFELLMIPITSLQDKYLWSKWFKKGDKKNVSGTSDEISD